MRWRLWCWGCDADELRDIPTKADEMTVGLDWYKAHQGHGLGGFMTPQVDDFGREVDGD